jgi:hypothetical protein
VTGVSVSSLSVPSPGMPIIRSVVTARYGGADSRSSPSKPKRSPSVPSTGSHS